MARSSAFVMKKTVRRQCAPTSGGNPLASVAVGGREPEHDGRGRHAEEGPDDFRILTPELRNPQLREEHAREFIGTVCNECDSALAPSQESGRAAKPLA